MENYEKLGAFYLGRQYDLAAGERRPDLLLYDAKDLTTHAVCVGMTGSGKTGLCLSLLEEAAIDGIPAIAIDPKGDLANLHLTFPDLRPDDFLPWVDEGAATRKGMDREQFAAHVAKQWREGLADWGQESERIQRFRDAVDMPIYTPGSSAGLPLTVLRSFAAPGKAVLEDSDALRERVTSSASGLLALVGIDADPIRSREHILVSNLLDKAWREGRDVEIADLIRDIQAPPLEKVGFMDLETFYPSKDRLELSMRINNLLASPGFAGWMEGEPLDVNRLLYTTEGKPRLTVISIAHLSDTERMFFVTILLNEIVAWVRSQPGTSSLRALLYMDEIFGYFPPTANPPSKTPMLTLLKQARAYGLGVVLATQNPVDLDYKGLSNTGTWFLGRLQTERDKARVLEGLEGASAEAGSKFNRQAMEETLAGLGSRVFLMNNVHEDEPVVFQTRWALSYLRGPLTRTQIQTLMAERKKVAAAAPAASAAPAGPVREQVGAAAAQKAERPIVPPDVPEYFLPRRGSLTEGSRMIYRPALLGIGRLHFSRSTAKVDIWRETALFCPLRGEVPEKVWEEAEVLVDGDPDLDREPADRASFAALPSGLTRAKQYATWGKQLKAHLYSEHALKLWKCADLKLISTPDESETDFRIRLRQSIREKRDLEVEKLRKKFTSKLSSVRDRIRKAEERVDRETSQYKSHAMQTAVSFGTSVLGALFGRKLGSVTNVGRAGTAMRSASRTAQQRDDIGRAREEKEAQIEKLEELEEEMEEEIEELEESLSADKVELEELHIRPRKTDISIEKVALVWAPWRVDADGIAEPLFEMPARASE